MTRRGTAKLPEAVSSVQPLPPKQMLDGDPHAPGGYLEGYTEAGGFPLPPDEPVLRLVRPRRRKAAPVLVAKADPRCWSVARYLCQDLDRLSVGKDGSVTIHNHSWQAAKARKEAVR